VTKKDILAFVDRAGAEPLLAASPARGDRSGSAASHTGRRTARPPRTAPSTTAAGGRGETVIR
jgi:hypothetical protein